MTLITQNVDGLHQQAGSRDALELHGNIRRMKCFEHRHPAVSWDDSEQRPPHCAICGSLLRPDVVWFTEDLPASAWDRAQQAAESGDVFFSIGTSMLVYPAAAVPLTALQTGAQVIQINPEPTDLVRHAQFNLYGKAGEVLPALLEAVWSDRR